MHAQDCTYWGATVCFFALICAVLTFPFFVFLPFPFFWSFARVCACVGTSNQHHECRCCQFDLNFVLQRSEFGLNFLLCVVMSFSAVRTDFCLFCFFNQEDKHTAPVSWTNFYMVNLIIGTKPAWTI